MLALERFMSGINQSIVLDIARLRSSFNDDIGNSKVISGSGFWMKHKQGRIFVTNKHNVDPRLKLGEDTPYILKKLEIELRMFDGNTPKDATQYFTVNLIHTPPVLSEIADVAVFFDPRFLTPSGSFRPGNVLSSSDLADAAFFANSVALMDTASFIGFAGNSMSRWWDSKWNLGVARTVNIASVPDIPFTHEDVRTSDTILVAGLSFSGSSGSIVVLHEKSIKPGLGLQNRNYVPPKVIGIMSGHWWDADQDPGMFRHSGLSYFTRSTSILALV
jgi:hypothetical protein